LVLVPSYQIAKYSYGIYLTHSFALLLGPCIFRGYSVTLSLVCELIALIVLPLIAYHLIEHPMIRLGSRLAARADSRYEQRELRQLAAK
jgi:peptidoglycan/LPS O-acetylase OafA/YrhL